MIKTGLFWRFEGTHYYTAQGESLEDYNFLSKKLLITKVVFQMPSSLLGRTTVLVCRHHSVCADITPHNSYPAGRNHFCDTDSHCDGQENFI